MARKKKDGGGMPPVEGGPAPSSSAENAAGGSTPKKVRGRPFQKGQSGNPKGKTPNALNAAHRLIRQKLEASAEAVIDALIARATSRDKDGRPNGSTDALELIVSRLCPPLKHAPRQPFELGALDTVEDCKQASVRIAAAAAGGQLDDDHAAALSARVSDVAKIVTGAQLAERIERLESALKMYEARSAGGLQ